MDRPWHIRFRSGGFHRPALRVGDGLFVGLRTGGEQLIYHSTDDGLTWQKQLSDIRIGEDRYNLIANPEGTGLWAIISEFDGHPAELRESQDLGATWSRVDDGSFPPNNGTDSP